MAQQATTEVSLHARATRAPSGCWLWSGQRDRDGYGSVSYRNRRWGAHRLAWFFRRGPIPKGLFVCHRCDVPACINPEHLFLGSPRDNTQDSATKGRRADTRGSRHGNSKVTEAQVVEMRAAFAAGDPVATIARRVGMSPANTKKIVLSETWKHVPIAMERLR